MKIAIDISQIVYGTGVSFYTQNLVEGLARVDKKNEYLLVGTSLRRTEELENFYIKIKKINPNFKKKFFRVPINLAEIWANQWRFDSLDKYIGRVDVFHSSDWLQPPVRAAKVTTLHDFAFWRYPQTAHPRILRVASRRLKLVAKEIDRAIAISQTTAQDARDFLKIPPEKIKVVYEAAGKEFSKRSSKKIEKVKAKFGIKNNYLLSVATIEPRKNLGKILEAFFLFLKENPDFSLVIVGKIGWDKIVARLREKLPRVIFTGYLPIEELVSLYSGASCLVFPSLYEGFGLPILEAFACGCPVVTAASGSMPEIAGKSAVLVNPLRADSIYFGIKNCLENKEELIKRGLERVKKFSWEKAARKTLGVYEEAFCEK